MTVFDAQGLVLSLRGDLELMHGATGPQEQLYRSKGSIACCKTEILLRGKGWCVWPNREGEGFSIDRVYPVLKELGCLETGISLSWPATASAAAVAVFPEEGPGILIRNLPEEEGRHREIRILAESEEHIRFEIIGPAGRWQVSPALRRWEPSAYAPSMQISRQYQVGIIGPHGENHLLQNGGFAGLVSLGENLMKQKNIGNRPVLHIFGYGAGHDRGYPDYSPSPLLGGAAALREAVRQLKGMGFRLSFYMNARLAEEEALARFPHLKDAVCRDREGRSVREEYFGRSFCIMQPSSPIWKAELLKQAVMLQELGADLIQLDQVAGRAAAVPPGEIWGEGYNDLIRSIREGGSEIWIQGVSDYYEADCFEMTWRDLNVLRGGILRGGNPFGETDLTLLQLLSFKGTLLCPVTKLKQCGTEGFSFRMDMMGDRGIPPVYGPSYLEELLRIK